MRLQEVEALLEPIRFDGAAARSYGPIVAADVGEGRTPRSDNRNAELSERAALQVQGGPAGRV